MTRATLDSAQAAARATQPLERILDLARWTPSGDNTQPWRFELLDAERVRVHAIGAAEHGVYDLQGHANQLAMGALLETMAIAASNVERRMLAPDMRTAADGTTYFEVRFEAAHGNGADPLAACIERRTVQRRSMSTRALSGTQKIQLAGALPPGFGVLWYEGLGARWRMAKFAFANARIRLTIPEAYEIHRKVIAWGQRYSPDRIPEQALGIDAVTGRFMHWALQSWQRIRFLNTYCLGHVLPRVQMDLVPGLRCGAHFALFAPAPLQSAHDYYQAGRALQRFWLALTALDWFMQPQMTPILFTQYVRQRQHFTDVQEATRLAQTLNAQLIGLIAPRNIDSLFFLGRMGAGPKPAARSLRKALAQLLLTSATARTQGANAIAPTAAAQRPAGTSAPVRPT
jgi:nitroreductase